MSLSQILLSSHSWTLTRLLQVILLLDIVRVEPQSLNGVQALPLAGILRHTLQVQIFCTTQDSKTQLGLYVTA